MENGYVQIGVTHLTTKPADLITPEGTPDGTWTVIDRLEALDGTVVEVVPEPIDEGATDVEQLAAVDDSALPTQKKNLEGEDIKEGSWGEETAFTVGDTEITKE